MCDVEYGFARKMTWHIKTSRVEAPITDHLRDFVPNLKKYEAVENFPM